MVAGTISVFGYSKVQSFLQQKFKLWDTCGVNNLHGMPGILGGLVSVFAVLLASNKKYEQSSNINEQSCSLRRYLVVLG